MGANVPAAKFLGPQLHPRGSPDEETKIRREVNAPSDFLSKAAQGNLRLGAAAAVHHETKAEPKEDSASPPFKPSLPVSFNSFAFIPSRPPLGADTYFREDTLGHNRSPSRKVPRAPPIPRQIQSHDHGHGHYGDRYETEEEEYIPAYEERQHFPDYDYDYESIQHEVDGRNPQDDDHHYAPYYEGDEYHASPTLRCHHHPPHEEIPNHHTSPDLRHYPHYHTTPDARPPSRPKTPADEGRDAAPCKIVQKNDMTCEVS